MNSSEFTERAIATIHSSPVDSLNTILMLMCETVGADYGGIVTFDRQNQSLEIEVLHGYTEANAREYRSTRKTLPSQADTSVSRKALTEALAQSPPEPVLIIKEGSDPVQLEIAPVDQTLSYAVSSADDIIGVITLERKEGSSFPRFDETSLHLRALIETCARVTAVALAARQSFVYSFDDFIRQKEFSDTSALGRDVAGWIHNKFKANMCSIYSIAMDYSQETGKESLRCIARIVEGRPELNPERHVFELEEDYAAHMLTPKRFSFASLDGDSLPETGDQRLPPSIYQIIGQLRGKYSHVPFESYLGVPTLYREQLQGWVEVLDTERKYGFTDAGLLTLIARRFASEYSRIKREEQRENLFAIPNIETGDLALVIREIVINAMKATAATHGLFLNHRKDGVFHPESARGYGLADAPLSPVHREQKNLAAWVIKHRKRGALIFPDLSDRSTIEPDLAMYLDESFLPGGLLPPKTRSLLMVPAYFRDPMTGSVEDLGVLILMSYKPNAFKRDEILVTIMAELVSYHIWASRKSEQVSQLMQAMPYYSKAAMAAVAAAGTVHTARQHIREVEKNIEALLRSKDVREHRELLKLAEGIQKQFNDLTVIYNRLHDIFRGGPDDALVGPVLFEECDLVALVQEVRSYMEPTFRERNIHFDATGLRSANLPKLKADSVLFRVVFINLINNSIDAGARRITVAARRTTCLDEATHQPRPAVEVMFKDDGIGIPLENQEQVFNLFFTQNKKGGSGLGLAVNRDILQKHAGEIKVVSSKPGGGTVISLVWPTDLK